MAELEELPVLGEGVDFVGIVEEVELAGLVAGVELVGLVGVGALIVAWGILTAGLGGPGGWFLGDVGEDG